MQKFVLFISFFLLVMACSQQSRDNRQNNNQDSSISNNDQPAIPGNDHNNLKLQTYTNDKFNFEIKYPQGWRIVENNVGGNFPVINVYDSQYDGVLEIPANVHAPAEVTYLSIFPKGYGTEMPSGRSIILSKTSLPLNLDIELNKQESTLFTLENEDAWAYLLVAKNTPDPWKNGFIFAQVSTNNFSITCYDETTGNEISMDDCDPMTGDRIIRKGEKDAQSADEIAAILESFQFIREENENPKVTELIEIDQPLPNQDIRSPITIKGKAKGMWYFEADFPVELVDKEGNVIAKAIAKAQGPWMTEDFVPFSTTLTYANPPHDERGYLVFHRANASGLPENDMEYRLPVIFPPR